MPEHFKVVCIMQGAIQVICFLPLGVRIARVNKDMFKVKASWRKMDHGHYCK